jgi:N-methylhydantoinase A/oxoprolinase/acetone carboxylase beta subunit
MEVQGREALSRSIPPAQVSFRRYGEMHYRRQGYEIRVPIPLGELGPDSVTEIKANFEGVYREQYGHIMPDTPIDAVSWRVIAQGPKPDLILPSARPRSGGAGEAKKGSRYIYLPLTKDFGQVPVYDRYALGAGQSLNGPAVIEERESTVVINGPAKIGVDQANNLMVELGSGTGE